MRLVQAQVLELELAREPEPGLGQGPEPGLGQEPEPGLGQGPGQEQGPGPRRQVGSQLTTVPAESTIFSFSLIYLLIKF